MTGYTKILYSTITLALLPCLGCQTAQPPAAPQDREKIFSNPALDADISAVVNAEIANGTIPGAVVLIGDNKRILYHRAFGSRSLLPEKTDMTADCIFDIASLSKPVSTAACINILIDRGRLKLDTKVSDIIPDFAAKQKQDITIAHLLTHTSGLPAYTNADALAKKYGNPCRKNVLEQICSLDLQSKPGETFRYSCLGYITLGRIVEIISHKSLDRFARENVFAPIGMKDTSYNPDPALAQRIAPTEMTNGQCLLGTVHDPLARLMEGVSGNAGVFSTAEDLARFCTMLLNNGKARGRKVLSPAAVRRLTQPQTVGRAYGFDVSSSYAWLKGDGFSPSAFCHTGYTGASIVCDPVSNIYLIILTNRPHPADKGSVKNLRLRLADITSHALVPPKQQ